ncbi:MULTISPECIES: bifunctional oligoribonuclease/PAP phosphatase NrnA [unclassified Desulfurobacterium]|uniref:DHH family phosphoesterase n=1 Tax=unclassified Desulfurobacterium TaxID=2639089 RepID=UPI000483B3FA|nr:MULTISPECIES: bifunctional oligoribonuclease/PAP phosphatase NrnA [unclassified Desulfurobacterium]
MTRREVAQLIENMGGRILITSHKNPDGDAIGSALGWFNFLRKLKSNVKVILYDEVPYFYDFLPNVGKIVSSKKIEEQFDWAIILDVSELSRTGFESISARNSLVIDHHATANPQSTFAIVEPSMPSTCELSLEIMKLIGEELIDYDVALPIYTGMVTDTGSFGYSSTTPQTLRNAAFLLEKGINPYTVIKNLFERNRVTRIKLLQKVLETLDFALDGKIAYITLYQRFIEETGAGIEETEGFIKYPRSIDGVEVAVFFKEYEAGKWKVSLRSKGKVDVADISRKFGGGGHVMAAGFEYAGEGGLERLKEELFKVIESALFQ